MNVVLAVAVLTGLFMVSYEKIHRRQGRGGGARDAGLSRGQSRNSGGRQDRAAERQSQPGLGRHHHDGDGATWAARLTVSVERGGHVFYATVTPVLDEKSGLGDAGWEGQNEIQVGAVTEGMPAAAAGSAAGRSDAEGQWHSDPLAFTLPEIIRKSDGKPVTVEYHARTGVTHTVHDDAGLQESGRTRRAG